MIKTLAKSIRDNKLPSILTLIFIMGEVLIEVMIPSTTAELINNIDAGAHWYRSLADLLRPLPVRELLRALLETLDVICLSVFKAFLFLI